MNSKTQIKTLGLDYRRSPVFNLVEEVLDRAEHGDMFCLALIQAARDRRRKMFDEEGDKK